jgi:aryl-alcohol dehydrogenase-like predicted oxidoreductase
MNCRTLARTGVHVSEIGYAAWGIGKGLWIGADTDHKWFFHPEWSRASRTGWFAANPGLLL